QQGYMADGPGALLVADATTDDLADVQYVSARLVQTTGFGWPTIEIGALVEGYDPLAQVVLIWAEPSHPISGVVVRFTGKAQHHAGSDNSARLAASDRDQAG